MHQIITFRNIGILLYNREYTQSEERLPLVVTPGPPPVAAIPIISRPNDDDDRHKLHGLVEHDAAYSFRSRTTTQIQVYPANNAEQETRDPYGGSNELKCEEPCKDRCIQATIRVAHISQKLHQLQASRYILSVLRKVSASIQK